MVGLFFYAINVSYVNFDIYVFITITGPIPLLVDYSPRGYHLPSSSQYFGNNMVC
jgi:hypothetical protein